MSTCCSPTWNWSKHISMSPKLPISSVGCHVEDKDREGVRNCMIELRDRSNNYMKDPQIKDQVFSVEVYPVTWGTGNPKELTDIRYPW